MTFLFFALAWIAGILLGSLLWSVGLTGCATPGWPFFVVSAVMLMPALLGRRFSGARYVSLLALTVALGAWRYTAHPAAPCLTPQNLAYYHADLDEPLRAEVEGVIVSYPEQSNGQVIYRLRAERLWTGDAPRAVTGDMLVRTRDYPPYHYGDRLRAAGEIENPPIYADFDYRAYLARQGIYSRMVNAKTTRVASGEGSTFYRRLYAFRAHASDVLNRLLPEPAAALANGMILGIESGIPRDVADAFQATGTTHVIVISGSNIALLAGVLLAALGRLTGRNRAVIPVMVAIGFYVLLVGAGPSAVRAGVMGVLVVGAIALGRQSTAWVSLAASAVLMTIIDPLALWDVGFQISFAATLGLILFSPWFIEHFHGALGGRLMGDQAPSPISALGDGLAATLAAQVLVTPVLLFHFGRFSVTSLLANALILPAQPPILMGGMLTLLAGLVWEPLGRVIASVPWLFLTYTTEVVQLVARIPYGVVETGSWAQGMAVVYIAALIAGIGLRGATQRGWLALPRGEQLALIGAAALPLWVGLTAVSLQPDGRLHITFQSTESVETIRLTLPDGRRVLIADAPMESVTGAPFDLIIAPETPDDLEAQTAGADERRIDPRELAPHTALQFAENLTVERLGNGESWALAIRYGEFSTLAPAALDVATQAALADERAATGITLLRLPGGGTGCWPAEDFLAAIAPQTLLWPTDTTYPPSVAAGLAGRALRTPGDAAIEVVTDGKRYGLRQLTASPGFLR